MREAGRSSQVECIPAQGATTPAPTPVAAHKFHLLDGLRGIAACFVVWIHLAQIFGKHLLPPDAFLAVDFFFCLSGFVLAFAYEDRLQRGMTMAAFTRARLFRLYPVFGFAMCIGLAAYRIDPIFYGREFRPLVVMLISAGFNFLMLPSPHSSLFVFDVPLWTIFFDVLGSLLYAWLVRRCWARSWALFAIASAAFASLAAQRLMYGSINYGSAWNSKSWGFTRLGVSFFAGVLAYRLYRSRNPPRVRAKPATIWAAILCAAFVAALYCPVPTILAAPFELAVVAFGFPALCYFGARLDLRGQLAAVCTFFSLIAYPVYALHLPIAKLLSQVGWIRMLPQAWVAAGYSVIIAVLSWLTARWYEAPVRAWLGRRFANQSKTA